MKTFSALKQYLEEKLVIVGQGKPYGQVIFLAGGAGSGKSHAISNFIHAQNYKIFDPDALKAPYLKWNEITHRYPELLGRNQKNPEDASYVHMFLRDRVGLEDKILNRFFFALTKSNKETLPNIIFDRTFKDKQDIKSLIPRLLEAGYKKESMHIVWVLTDYKIALQQNVKRDRTVPVHVLLQSHEGVARNMRDILMDNYPYDMINGDAFIILGGEANTVYFEPPKNSRKTRKQFPDSKPVLAPKIVKNFDYLKVKESGEQIKSHAALSRIILFWILKNTQIKMQYKNI